MKESIESRNVFSALNRETVALIGSLLPSKQDKADSKRRQVRPSTATVRPQLLSRQTPKTSADVSSVQMIEKFRKSSTQSATIAEEVEKRKKARLLQRKKTENELKAKIIQFSSSESEISPVKKTVNHFFTQKPQQDGTLDNFTTKMVE